MLCLRQFFTIRLFMLPEDLCPKPGHVPHSKTLPHSPPIYLASVWACDSPAEADAMLAKQEAGYVYQRDGHPNGDLLADKLNQLEGAERGIVVASGMAAIAAPLLALVQAGEHVVIGSRVYGKTLSLVVGEAARLGIRTTQVDLGDLNQVSNAMQPTTRLVIGETIANPLLQVPDIAGLAEIAHRGGAKLLIDNTFATPLVCRPLDWGADLVMESLTKSLNGHSDVILGYLGGLGEVWSRVPGVVSAWGFSAPPFESWLAARGLMTAPLRIERACTNAQRVAEFLSEQPAVSEVFYPGLAGHPQHALAKKQFGGRFGSMISFRLGGERPAADRFIRAIQNDVPFCPSLGELSTTLSHPETTSHRGMTAEQRAALGITGGVIRLSVGCEVADSLCQWLRAGLAAV